MKEGKQQTINTEFQLRFRYCLLVPHYARRV